MSRSPIIITGMHRSGTSLFASLLHDAGLLVGKDLDQNSESDFFYKVNEKLLEMSGSSWHQPKTFTNLSQSLQKDLLNVVEQNMTRKGSIRYLGLTNWVTTRSNIARLSKPWGWKDPRNTFTWPIWKAKFPSAKFIHVVRNPIDVAVSLYKREEGYRQKTKSNSHHRSSNCLNSIDDTLDLWIKYEDEAEKLINSTPHQALVVKYEELVHQPQKEMEKVVIFLSQDGFEIDHIDFSNIIPKRAFANTYQDEYKVYYERIRENQHVKRLEYEKIFTC